MARNPIIREPKQEAPITYEEHEGSEERNCFYCLEGWVFLGSIGHDGEEIVESIRCRRCNGTGRINLYPLYNRPCTHHLRGAHHFGNVCRSFQARGQAPRPLREQATQ